MRKNLLFGKFGGFMNFKKIAIISILTAAVAMVSACGKEAEDTELLSKVAGAAGITADYASAYNKVLTGVYVNDTNAVSATPENATEEEIEIVSGYNNLGVCQVESGNLNIRKEPNEEAGLCGKLPNNAGCEILEDLDGWYHISSGEIDGYVKSDYILTGEDAENKAYEVMEKIATVTADALRVRAEMNTDCEIMTCIPHGERIVVTNEYDDWIELEIDDEVGYCAKEFVEITTELRDAMTLTEARFGEGVTDGRAALVNFALQYVGNRYVWGGTSLEHGIDCSGFTMRVYQQFGYSLPHYSGSQAQMGTAITMAEAQPGDLIFYGSGKRIGHVAIYMGNGQIVHASNKRDGIKISSAYYRTPLKVVRIIND